MNADQVKTIAMSAAVIVVGVLAWKASKAIGGAVDSVGNAIDQAKQAAELGAAQVKQTLANAFSAPASGGDPVRLALYGNAGYTGADIAGLTPMDGQWFTDEEARQYEYAQQEAYRLANRSTAPVVGSNGAAFGVYPKP